MRNELKGRIELSSTNTEDFIKEIIALTKEGCDYVPFTGSMTMQGLGKNAVFQRPVIQKEFAELPEELLEASKVEEVVVDQPVVENVAEETSDITNKLPDWDLVKSFKNVDDMKKSKDELADYAKSEFNLKLKKNVSFEKMVKNFENSL